MGADDQETVEVTIRAGRRTASASDVLIEREAWDCGMFGAMLGQVVGMIRPPRISQVLACMAHELIPDGFSDLGGEIDEAEIAFFDAVQRLVVAWDAMDDAIEAEGERTGDPA